MDDQLKKQMLDMLLGSLTDEAKKFATEEIDKIKQTVNEDLSKMKSDAEKLKTELDKVLEDCPTVVNLGTIEKPKKELTHSCFDTVLKVISSAKRKEKNVMLVGGAGGGKTHLVKQIADVLKLPFYPMSVGMQTTKSDLLGFVNATGQYISSCVRMAYENGGVLLLDEFDSAHAGVVTILNSLLANGHCSFPDKVVDKHKDFICLVACNTYGQGANLDYIGRNRLDGATLDRFIVVDVDYDSKLERKLTKDSWWYSIIGKIRKNAEKNGIRVIISPRACMDGADLLEAGFNPTQVLEMVVFKGCAEDIKKKLLYGIDINRPKEGENEKSNQTDGQAKTDDEDYLIDLQLFQSENQGRFIKMACGNGYSISDSNGEGRINIDSKYIANGIANLQKKEVVFDYDIAEGVFFSVSRDGFGVGAVENMLKWLSERELNATKSGKVRISFYKEILDSKPCSEIVLNPTVVEER